MAADDALWLIRPLLALGVTPDQIRCITQSLEIGVNFAEVTGEMVPPPWVPLPDSVAPGELIAAWQETVRRFNATPS